MLTSSAVLRSDFSEKRRETKAPEVTRSGAGSALPAAPPPLSALIDLSAVYCAGCWQKFHVFLN